VVVHVEPRRRGLDLRQRVLATALAEPLVVEAHDVTIFERDGSAEVSLHLKFPADVELAVAAEVAARIERAIRLRPGVAAVQTHLEPLEETLRAREPDPVAERRARGQIERLVIARTGSAPTHIKLLRTDAGSVVFLTLAVGREATLAGAHQLAGELEDQLRKELPDIADVVVHTET
jgi:divalent metal cation (Fe/Co/Zn/Cd) transporter